MSMDRSALLALAAVLVGACGGGGGGDDNSGGNNPPPPPPASGAITSDNADEVAGAIVTSTQFIRNFGLPDVAGPFIPAGVANMQPAGSMSQIADAINGGIRRGIANMREIQVETEDTIPCTLGGQIVVTANVANEGALTVGDVVSVVFESCTEVAGTTDGSVDLTVTEVTGDVTAPPFSAGLDVNISGVTLVQDATTVSADGLLSAVIEAPSDAELSLTLNGTDLATEVEGDTAVLEAFDIAEVDDLNTGAYTLDYSGSIDAETLGAFDFETTTTFTGNGGQHPSAGELMIHGDDDTSARVTAIDNVNVQLSIDTDGDGTEDDVIDTTWDALSGA